MYVTVILIFIKYSMNFEFIFIYRQHNLWLTWIAFYLDPLHTTEDQAFEFRSLTNQKNNVFL